MKMFNPLLVAYIISFMIGKTDWWEEQFLLEQAQSGSHGTKLCTNPEMVLSALQCGVCPMNMSFPIKFPNFTVLRSKMMRKLRMELIDGSNLYQ